MDFNGYIGAITAISMINNHCNNERYKDVNTKWVEEDRMTDGAKEVVHSPGVHGAFKYTCGSFMVPSGKWEF